MQDASVYHEEHVLLLRCEMERRKWTFWTLFHDVTL